MSSFTLQVVVITIIFAGVMAVYGVGSGVPQLSETINQITGPWPTVGTSSCTFSANGPSGSCSIIDTAALGTIWLFTSLGSIFYRIGGTFYLLYQLLSIIGLLSGIPVLGPIFVGIFGFVIGAYALSHLPGVGKGGGHL